MIPSEFDAIALADLRECLRERDGKDTLPDIIAELITRSHLRRSEGHGGIAYLLGDIAQALSTHSRINDKLTEMLLADRGGRT